MSKQILLVCKSLGSLGVKAYHKLSTSKYTIPRIRCLVDQQQIVTRLMPNTPVRLILYNISNICDSVRLAVPKWRDEIIRLLSLGWSLDGHNPYSAQVLRLPFKGDANA